MMIYKILIRNWIKKKIHRKEPSSVDPKGRKQNELLKKDEKVQSKDLNVNHSEKVQ